MEYNFNIKVAEKYGVEEAVLVHNLFHWIRKNKANGKNFHDGYYWTYNSLRAFSELFPFWSKRQLERIISNLVDKGAISTSTYNEVAYDRTKWYTILDEDIFNFYGETISLYCISPNGEILFPEPLNGSTQTVTPIPDSKPLNKPDSKTLEVVCLDFIQKFNTVRKSRFKITDKIKKALGQRIKDYSLDQIIKALMCAMTHQYHKDNNFIHLTPEFILRSDKLDKYFNACQSEKTNQQSDSTPMTDDEYENYVRPKLNQLT